MGRKSKRKKLIRNAGNVGDVGSAPGRVGNDNSNNPTSQRSSIPTFQHSNILIRVIRWGAYIALFAPLIVHPDFFFPFVVPKTLFFWMLAEIIFAAWVLLAISNKQFRPHWNAVSLSLVAFLLVTIVTSFTGIDAARSFWSTFERMAGTINWIHFAMFFAALAFTLKTIGEWKKLLSVSLISASLVSVIFLLDKFFGVAAVPFETKGGATIGNSSFMAAYLLFNVFFGIWLFSKARGALWKSLYAAGLALIIVAVLYATAYGALVSMFGGFFIVLLAWLFFMQKMPFARTISASLLFASIFIMGAIVWGTFSQNNAVLNKLPYFFSDKGTIGARKVIWRMAWEGVKERPVLGWGPENFPYVFTRHFNPCLPLSECGSEVWFDRTHNIILDHLINSGIVGLLSYLVLFVAALFMLWRNFWHTRDDWLTPSILTAALASYFAQNLLVFDMPNTYLMFSVTLAFAAGLNSATPRDTVAEPVKLLNPRPFAVGVVGLILFYYFFSFGIQSVQVAHWAISINRAGLSPEDRVALYEKSLSASPLGNRQTVEFITNNISQALGSEELDPFLIKRVGEIMAENVNKYPEDFRQHLLLGTFYTAARNFDETYLAKAEEVLLRAIELAPTNQLGYISISQAYMFQNKPVESISALQKAVELEPRYGRAHRTLGDVYRAFGDNERAEEAYRRARELGA